MAYWESIPLGHGENLTDGVEHIWYYRDGMVVLANFAFMVLWFCATLQAVLVYIYTLYLQQSSPLAKGIANALINGISLWPRVQLCVTICGASAYTQWDLLPGGKRKRTCHPSARKVRDVGVCDNHYERGICASIDLSF